MSKQIQEPNIVRAKHGASTAYFLMSRATAQDETLSLEAIGTLAYLLSKPDTWVVRNHDLEKLGTPSKIKRIIKELTTHGYLSKPERIRDPKTKKFTGWTDRKVYETPQNTVSQKPKVRKTEGTENQPLDNTEIDNTDKEKELTTLSDKPIAGYSDDDLTLAIQTVWQAHNKIGCTPKADEAKAMFSDAEYQQVIDCAEQNAKAQKALDELRKDTQVTPMGDLSLPEYTQKLVEDEKSRQAGKDYASSLQLLEPQSPRDEQAKKIVQPDLQAPSANDDRRMFGETSPKTIKVKPKAKPRNEVFDWLLQYAWNIDVETYDKLDKAAKKMTGARIGKVKKVICAIHKTNNTDCTAAHLNIFMKWYKKNIPNTAIPRDAGKWGEHYLAFYTAQKAMVQTNQNTQDILAAINSSNMTPPEIDVI